MFERTHRYQPRSVTSLGMHDRAGYRVKIYSIALDAMPIDLDSYAAMLDLAIDRDLPRPATTTHRPGVAFAIFHQGRGWHYLVLSWWDNENELPQRVYVRPTDDPNVDWRPARGSESVCIWDLQIMAFERDAYVRHVLSGDTPNLDAYLAAGYPHSTA